MVYRSLFVAAALLLVVLSGLQTAEAKSATYVLTGGELGMYAYAFPHLTEGENPQPLDLPGADAQIAPPLRNPQSLSYDLYRSSHLFSVASQVAEGGPELRYYPHARLLYERPTDRWYELGPEPAAFLEATIEDALLSKELGELDTNPIAADLRTSGLLDAQFWLTGYSPGGVLASPQDCLKECPAILVSGEEFVLGHLVETLSQPPKGPTVESPTLAIGVWGDSIIGYLAYYTPPTGDRRGRFWPGGDPLELPYYETTPGFDAVIGEALARSELWGRVPADAVSLESQSEGRVSIWLWIGGVAGCLAALLAGGAIFYRRRIA